MKVTNELGLPAQVVAAVENDPYEAHGDISVTGLIRPPQMRAMELRHAAELEQDASDRIWSLLGSATHAVLERVPEDGTVRERRLSMRAGGWTVSGQTDCYDPAAERITDYKVTSAWSVLSGEIKPEWTAQLNCYAALHRANGYPVRSAAIVAILRDWSRSRLRQSDDYPRKPVVMLHAPMWEQTAAVRWMEERIAMHRAAVERGDLVPCTADERWAKPDLWAVSKIGIKKAYRLLQSRSEAEWTAKRQTESTGVGHTIELRPGKSVRCADYCVVAPFCEQYAAERNAG